MLMEVWGEYFPACLLRKDSEQHLQIVFGGYCGQSCRPDIIIHDYVYQGQFSILQQEVIFHS